MPREWGCEWLVLRRRTSQSTRLVLAVLAVLAVLRGTDGSSGDHIFGAGATFPAQLYRDAMFAYGFVADVDVTYLPVGSTGGICRILDGSEACDEKGAPYEVHFAGLCSITVRLN